MISKVVVQLVLAVDQLDKKQKCEKLVFLLFLLSIETMIMIT